MIRSVIPQTRKVRNAWLWLLALLVLFALSQGFTRRSIWLGLWGLTNDLTGLSPFFDANLPFTTFIMYLHMITGGAMMLLAPLQLPEMLRRKSRNYHRWAGYVTIIFGFVTAFGAIVYAIVHGTTGGRFMDVSSVAYGVLMLLASWQTLRQGRARSWAAHRRWGWRLVVLVVAAWLYRMHYVIWHALFGDLWVTEDMRGPFDQFQAWAFFLQYLLLLEIWFWHEARRKKYLKNDTKAI